MASDRLARVAERHALSEFARHCRQNASPEDLGISIGPRRRTKGLRREEVATLAGVGLTWYTWFEQGRDIQVSDDFLTRLVRGLKLDRAQQEHLYALAGRNLATSSGDQPALPLGLVNMINGLPDPAYILNRRWDVLAFNSAAAALFSGFTEENPNMLRVVFFSDEYRDRVRDWQLMARLMFLKARHDYLTGGKDPILRALLDNITNAFPFTRDWWSDPEVVRIGDNEKELYDPLKGWRHYQLNVLVYEDRPDIRVVVYGQITPVSFDNDADQIRLGV
ncbi:helix-turn-helix domain-containing protein [Agrobacterium vitis]|uniref:helix-turn-helix transcriptional regulator n=1 Tax=Allorhizobium ampelinum TaxID=3025782 RepID=UPI001F16EFA9|nr:helix-turn-helix transcriptional regulator [Allorhizobium ampelinum]MCF1450350.1 helix-turn-helix domain-containing protein [Allorhizobium ampelinum]